MTYRAPRTQSAAGTARHVAVQSIPALLAVFAGRLVLLVGPITHGPRGPVLYFQPSHLSRRQSVVRAARRRR